MPGNQFGDKLNHLQKQLAYKQYCEHISKGLSKEAWRYRDPQDNNLHLGWQTLEVYMKNNPEAFDTSQLEEAYADSRLFFEQTGLEMMTGTNSKGNAAIFQIFMRNKFGWDKDKKEEDKVINVIRES
jgi:hypothetical protein